MKAVVWPGIGDIRLDTVPDPGIKEPTDAVIRITRSATCGTDPHFVRGTMSPMTEGTILGHEAVSVVETVGDDVRGFLPVTGSWSARRSAAGTARTAGSATTPSATWPIPTARTPAPASSGPVGQFAIASAQRQGAGRVLAVDGIETRLAAALEQNAEVIDQWVPGDAPSLAARWAVEAVAKAGSVGIIGVYSRSSTRTRSARP
jgi:threonine dehydrogenase-like Zn-dependent dehydrogenase